jgi:DNA-binding NarL/FixJ family response regulator
MKKNKIIIIDDDYAIAEYMQEKINELKNYSCELICTNPLLFIKDPIEADIYLLDIVMGNINGISLIDKILNIYPNSKIIMNTIKDDPDTIFQALRIGALGYIDKQSFELDLLTVFESVMNNGAYMTPKIARKVIDFYNKPKNDLSHLSNRERDIVNGILDGLSYKLIAYRYDISLDNVRMNVKRVYRKLNINSKTELFKKLNQI